MWHFILNVFLLAVALPRFPACTPIFLLLWNLAVNYSKISLQRIVFGWNGRSFNPCCGLNVCAPLKIHMLKTQPNVLVLECGPFGWCFGSEGATPINGFSACIIETDLDWTTPVFPTILKNFSVIEWRQFLI